MSCISPTAPHFSSSSPSRRAKCRITPSTARPWVIRAGESLYLHNSWYASSLVGFKLHYSLSRFICISSNHTRRLLRNQPGRQDWLALDEFAQVLHGHQAPVTRVTISQNYI